MRKNKQRINCNSSYFLQDGKTLLTGNVCGGTEKWVKLNVGDEDGGTAGSDALHFFCGALLKYIYYVVTQVLGLALVISSTFSVFKQ